MGFSSDGYFTNGFKKHEGMTPKDFGGIFNAGANNLLGPDQNLQPIFITKSYKFLCLIVYEGNNKLSGRISAS
jgi:AraC-like DNA-binding protein